jgi:hypothetical protein
VCPDNVSVQYKADRHDITEILLKVALNTINSKKGELLLYINVLGLAKFVDAESHFQQYFSYIVAVSFIGGGNRSTRKVTFHLKTRKMSSCTI